MWSSDYLRISCLQREEKKREVMEGEVNLQRIQMKFKVCYDVTLHHLASLLEMLSIAFYLRKF